MFVLFLLTIFISEAIPDLLTCRPVSHENRQEMNDFFFSVICGNFNQGDQRFGNSVGKQCACILLFSIIFSQLKEIGKWQSLDLDLILVCGDITYKDPSINRILGVEDLPKTIKLDKKTVADILFLESVSGFLDLSNTESMQILKDNLNHVKDFNSHECLFFVSDLCVAIIRKAFQSSEEFFI